MVIVLVRNNISTSLFVQNTS